MNNDTSGIEKIIKLNRKRSKPGAAAAARTLLILPPPSAPMAVAREFVRLRCLHNGDADTLTLRYWRDGWWTWRGSHWTEIEARGVRARLYVFTEHAVYAADKGLKPWAPNRKKIGDLLEALGAIVILADELDQPCWMDGRPSGTIVAVANGLLDIGSRRLMEHSTAYWNQTAVPFDYDPDALEPTKWLRFLGELWPREPGAAGLTESGDRDEVSLLAEWFGYVVSGRLDLHKILLMVGPTRGGKGVISRILTALVGRRNICGPTLNSLGGEFGLAPLLGKPLAIISDARFVGRNGNVVVERLLSISGEDALTVNRKYRDQWTGKLPTRLHIISNELPKLGDASMAVVGRVLLLLLTQSWLGREDHGLEDALRVELPSILNWALDGLTRLAKSGRFTQTKGAAKAIVAMRDLASPVAAFVRERCTVDKAREIGVDDLYGAYKGWCDEGMHFKGSAHVFGRDLVAAVPSIRRTRRGAGTDRRYVYEGIGLRKAGDKEEEEE